MSFVYNKRLSLFDVTNYTLLTLISIVSILPFLYVISVSLTDSNVYIPFEFNIFPQKLSLDAYIHILKRDSFINAFKSTLFITIIGTILNIIVTFTISYGLTDKSLPQRNFIFGIVIFSLVFNAGIIPQYLLIKELGLLNSYWALILSALTNAWSIIVVKSFMDSLPSELKDAAKIDGCNDLQIFIKIIMPLSKPAIAAFTLFFAIAHWNTYFNALIYLTDSTKWTLQILVKSLVIDSTSSTYAASQGVDQIIPQETIRLAAVVVAMMPILIVYPFLQKHFAKGVMLGSVKG
jgi:putative aldouronate transport system permease protein